MVDKPAGVVVHPARGHRPGTLAQALAGTVAGRRAIPTAPAIVHRLDRDTSGLLVRRPLRRRCTPRSRPLLAARALVREYLALVEGRPPARRGTIDAPLGRDRRVRTRVSTETDEPRAAITHFEVERALPHDTLLRVRLETGPHAPDPRAPARDRPSGRRRPGVRDAGPPRARAPVPARRPAGVPASGHRRAGRRALAAAGRPGGGAGAGGEVIADRSTGLLRGRAGRPASAPTHRAPTSCAIRFV